MANSTIAPNIQVAMTYAVVLFSIVVQGLTVGCVIAATRPNSR